MKRFFVLGILLLGLAGLGLMSGCSDDDNPTGTQLGDTSSVKFQFIDSTLGEDMFDEFGQSIDISMELLSSHLGGSFAGPKGHPIMSLQGDESIIINSIDTWEFTDDFWWVFTFDATIAEGDDSTYLSGTDSVQLLLGTSPLESYEGELNYDALKARAHVNGTSNYDFEMSAHHRMDASVTEVGNDSIVTISGTTRDTLNLSVSDDLRECDLQLSQGLDLDNLKILIVDGCPLDGGITATFTIDLSCTGGDDPGPLEQLDIEGTWTISVIINDNGTATFTYTDGTTIWQVTRELDCGSQG